MTQPTDEQIWKMLDAWYQLTGRRIAPSADQRQRDFAAMQRHLEAFERETPRTAGDAPAATAAPAGYPPGWPSCACGAPVMDGHLTCGQASCSESDARESRKNSRTT